MIQVKYLHFHVNILVNSIDDLSDEGFYEKNNIEHIIEVDNVTKQNNVIPLGMVELTNDGRQCRGNIFIDIGKVENL